MRTLAGKKSCFVLIFMAAAGLVLSGTSARCETRDKLPEPLVKLPESGNAILVEKDTQRLFIYADRPGGPVKVFEKPCSTGEASGIKEVAGDKKTPEGVYFVKDIYEDRYLSPIYGRKAFPTDYPNYLDVRAGRNGSAIWLHGTNKKLKPMDTNGCIALNNDAVVQLTDFIEMDQTPVIITNVIHNTDPADLEKQKNAVNDWLQKWANGIESGVYHRYLAFYHPEFLPDMAWWEDWRKLSSKFAGKKHRLTITIERTGIYRYEDVYVIVFNMGVSLREKRVGFGRRKLFVKNGGEEYRIIGDLYQAYEKGYNDSQSPLLAASKRLVEQTGYKQQAVELVKEWLHAWSDEKMETYASFYSDRFYSSGMNKQQWMERKRRLARQYRYINVTGRDFQVSRTNGRLTVRFFQTYESSGYTTEGIKKLTLVKEDQSWKIYREIWKGK